MKVRKVEAFVGILEKMLDTDNVDLRWELAESIAQLKKHTDTLEIARRTPVKVQQYYQRHRQIIEMFGNRVKGTSAFSIPAEKIELARIEMERLDEKFPDLDEIEMEWKNSVTKLLDKEVDVMLKPLRWEDCKTLINGRDLVFLMKNDLVLKGDRVKKKKSKK